ncbi:MAG: hypothetical protein GX087_05060 [Desulfobulbaceae bacterium]|nr:hypothetical protein [Desulfobulbaceae bacterium]
MIELLPGSSYAISGPMPPKTDTLEEMIIEGVPADGTVRLVPKALFSGFWLGGSMWRGAIEVSPNAQEAEYVVLVKDQYGEKQNPALVFIIRIWGSQDVLNAHSSSFLTRRTGLSPFAFVAFFAFCGILTGMGNFLLGRRWTRLLAEHACSEIYKLTRSGEGTELTCDLPPGAAVVVGRQCPVFRANGEPLQSANVVSLQKKDVVLLIEGDNAVRVGDVVCLQAPAIEARRADTESN